MIMLKVVTYLAVSVSNGACPTVAIFATDTPHPSSIISTACMHIYHAGLSTELGSVSRTTVTISISFSPSWILNVPTSRHFVTVDAWWWSICDQVGLGERSYDMGIKRLIIKKGLKGLKKGQRTQIQSYSSKFWLRNNQFGGFCNGG